MLSNMLIAATLLCVIGVALAVESPVFLWGATKAAVQQPLHTVTESQFTQLIAPLLKDHMVVAFQEKNLAANDFLCENMVTSQSCYAHLQGITQKTFYASVENPTEALRALTTEHEFNTIGKSGNFETPLGCAAGKVVLVNFDDDAVEERAVALEAHDAVISAITKELNCPTVYLYMSTPSNDAAAVQSRKRRETAAPEGGRIFRVGSQFLIFFTNLTVSNNGQTEIIDIEGIQATNISSTEFNVTLSAANGKALTFNISLSYDNYYVMSGVSYDGIQYRATEVNAPTDFSFHCGNLTMYGISTATPIEISPYSLAWSSLQFQAPFNSTNNVTFVFGDSWDCVYFFTPSILMGLLVVILFLSIIFTGICWMMDINTMDRFDDPKGKTITINAAE